MFSFTQQGLESRHSSDETFPSLGLNVTLCVFDHWQWDTTHGHTSSSKQIRIFLGHQKKMRRRCISLPLAIWIWITCYLIFVRFSVSQIPVSIYFHNITQTARIYYRNLLSEKKTARSGEIQRTSAKFSGILTLWLVFCLWGNLIQIYPVTTSPAIYEVHICSKESLPYIRFCPISDCLISDPSCTDSEESNLAKPKVQELSSRSVYFYRH